MNKAIRSVSAILVIGLVCSCGNPKIAHTNKSYDNSSDAHAGIVFRIIQDLAYDGKSCPLKTDKAVLAKYKQYCEAKGMQPYYSIKWTGKYVGEGRNAIEFEFLGMREKYSTFEKLSEDDLMNVARMRDRALPYFRLNTKTGKYEFAETVENGIHDIAFTLTQLGLDEDVWIYDLEDPRVTSRLLTPYKSDIHKRFSVRFEHLPGNTATRLWVKSLSAGIEYEYFPLVQGRIAPEFGIRNEPVVPPLIN